MSTLAEVTTDKNVIDIYFLAAPEDEHHCRALQKYLNPVIRNSKQPILIHSDFEIPAGQDIASYKEKLYNSDIVLAFISADFIHNDVTYSRTQKVIERYNANETIMLPILVRNCMWKSTPFVNLPLLPKNFQPLNNKQYWNSEDDALTSVATDIYEAIKEYTEETSTEPNQVAEEPPKKVETATPISQEVTEENITSQEVTPKPLLNKDISPKDPEVVSDKIPETKSTVKRIHNTPMDVSWRKSYYKNTLLKRGVAFILDIIITAVPAIAIAFSAYFFFSGFLLGMFYPDDDVAEIGDFEMNFVLIASLFFYFVICAFFESSESKGTFGKQILKLEITDRKGERIGFFKAFFRNILRLLTAVSYFFIIPLIIQIITFSKYHKFFHDQISYTVVGEKIKKETRK